MELLKNNRHNKIWR